MRRLIQAIVISTATASCLTASGAYGQDCSAAVNAALADKSLEVESVTPEGVRIRLQGDLAKQSDPKALRALLANLDCALAGPGGRVKELELVTADRQVVARESGGTIVLPAEPPKP